MLSNKSADGPSQRRQNATSTFRGRRAGSAKTLALAALGAGLLGPPAFGEEPSLADVAAVKACTDMVANNAKNRPLHGPAEFEEEAGPQGRLAGAAKLSAFAEESCIGVLATACVQKEGEMAGDSQYRDCYDHEAQVWDKRLNAAYRDAQSHMEKDAGENLRKVQRAWIAWRDASCEQPWITFQGLMAGPMQAYCMLELTARQAIWMEGWVEEPKQ